MLHGAIPQHARGKHFALCNFFRGKEGGYSAAPLVGNLVSLLFPNSKRFERFSAHQLDHGYLAAREWRREFPIDHRVIESGVCRIARGSGKVNASGARPVDRTQAHRARFATRVNLASAELEATQLLASLADRNHLGVRGRVVRRDNGVRSLGYDFSVFHNDGAERTAPSRTDILNRKLDGSDHEGVTHRLRPIRDAFFFPRGAPDQIGWHDCNAAFQKPRANVGRGAIPATGSERALVDGGMVFAGLDLLHRDQQRDHNQANNRRQPEVIHE